MNIDKMRHQLERTAPRGPVPTLEEVLEEEARFAGALDDHIMVYLDSVLTRHEAWARVWGSDGR